MATADRNEAGRENEREGAAPAPVEAAGEALRAAVERTLAVTAGPAGETRGRAQALLDDVVRRGAQAREEVSRRSNAARRQMTRRGEEATARLADALAELRTADVERLDRLVERLAAVEARLASLEQRPRRETSGTESGGGAESNPKVEPEGPPQKGLD